MSGFSFFGKAGGKGKHGQHALFNAKLSNSKHLLQEYTLGNDDLTGMRYAREDEVSQTT